MAVLASETASTTGGRDGKSVSPDGKINLKISPPGSNGPGSNPEQLFAAGYSACFGGAILAAAGQAKVALRGADVKVTATVNLNKEDSGYFIDATLNAELNGVEQTQAESLVARDPAHANRAHGRSHLLFAGRMVHLKGGGYFLDALPHVAARLDRASVRRRSLPEAWRAASG